MIISGRVLLFWRLEQYIALTTLLTFGISVGDVKDLFPGFPCTDPLQIAVGVEIS